MPDYNPKDVPTLDDIIEKAVTGDTESDAVETEATKNDVDLLSDESIDLPPVNTVFAAAEHDNPETVQHIDEESGETPVYFSADKAEDDPDKTGSTLSDYNENEDNSSIIDQRSVEPAAQVSVEPISLELVVNNIVKQLIPDLEKQLKLQLKQALEESLPEEMVKSADTTHEN
ncbi:MAG: hypothetical protein GQ573_05255 [Gammaproteobacteria bacterium]|nr:hypothetical protein [Gammaproteobacteria bacterium]